jgi:hypothetical protein
MHNAAAARQVCLPVVVAHGLPAVVGLAGGVDQALQVDAAAQERKKE